jgi:ferritin-like metal-binding protein YciE
MSTMAFEEENNQAANQALEELSNSNYEIRHGEPDITGWNVLSRSGEKIGEVEDMLFDGEAQKVRYLIIQLQASGEEIYDDNRRVLAPVGVATLNTDNEEVALPIASAEEMAGLPAYRSGQLSPEDEVQIREIFGGSTAPYEHPQFYAHEHFNEDKFYNREALPDNTTIIPAENMDAEDNEPKSTEFPQGRIVGEYEATTEGVEQENSQPVEETGNNDYQLNEGFIPEPESIEQEEAWQEREANEKGDSKLLEFFVNELKDLLWAERELAETLPDMAEAATSQELKSAFTNHQAETETHAHRLEQIFGMLGLEPDTTKCDAMSGIIDEGDEIISDTEEGTAQRDVGLIFAGQKAEHYEIASYGGMISLAKMLGYPEIAEILIMTIDEEKAADALLTQIAEHHINYDASKEHSDD